MPEERKQIGGRGILKKEQIRGWEIKKKPADSLASKVPLTGVCVLVAVLGLHGVVTVAGKGHSPYGKELTVLSGINLAQPRLVPQHDTRECSILYTCDYNQAPQDMCLPGNTPVRIDAIHHLLYCAGSRLSARIIPQSTKLQVVPSGYPSSGYHVSSMVEAGAKTKSETQERVPNHCSLYAITMGVV